MLTVCNAVPGVSKALNMIIVHANRSVFLPHTFRWHQHQETCPIGVDHNNACPPDRRIGVTYLLLF